MSGNREIQDRLLTDEQKEARRLSIEARTFSVTVTNNQRRELVRMSAEEGRNLQLFVGDILRGAVEKAVREATVRRQASLVFLVVISLLTGAAAAIAFIPR